MVRAYARTHCSHAWIPAVSLPGAMAKEQRALLRETILMGVSRLVVEKGRVKASVLFDFKAEEKILKADKAGINKQKSSSSSMRSGTTGSFLESRGGVVGEQRGKRGAATAEPGLDRSLGDAELASDLVHGQVCDVMEHERLPLSLRQLLQRGDESHVALARFRGVGRLGHSAIGRAA